MKVVNPTSRTLTAVPEALRNLWAHRGLIRNFTSRDISQRYRNSIIGYFWTVLEPLLLSAVYYFLHHHFWQSGRKVPFVDHSRCGLAIFLERPQRIRELLDGQ